MPVDSLVLRIDEIEKQSGLVDSTLFVLYDHVNKEYLVRGSRRGSYFGKFTPYSFVSRTQEDVRIFLETTIGRDNLVSYTLINYNDLPYNSIEITYDYLYKKFDRIRNEVVGYDKCKLKYNDSYLNTNLRILRRVFNHYEEI